VTEIRSNTVVVGLSRDDVGKVDAVRVRRFQASVTRRG